MALIKHFLRFEGPHLHSDNTSNHLNSAHEPFTTQINRSHCKRGTADSTIQPGEKTRGRKRMQFFVFFKFKNCSTQQWFEVPKDKCPKI